MSGGEFQPVAPHDYGTLLMEVFDNVEYDEAELEEADKLAEVSIRIIDVKTRTRSEFDTQQGAWWILTDILNETEQFGEPNINRLLVLKKETDAGIVHLRFWEGIQKVSVMTSNYELPPDFSAHDEFIEGLRILAEAGRHDD